jgi:diguanylate cyclase (GGDEF)-like protein
VGIVWVRHCADGVLALADKPATSTAPDDRILAVVLDLDLPDSRGIDTFSRLFQAARSIPILILANAKDEDIAKRAVQRGAQDYLLKGHRDAQVLPNAVRRMIERSATTDPLSDELERAQVAQISHVAHHDGLTGLPNRTLLNARLSEALALAARYQRQLAVMFLDIDRFKHINDSMGPVIGDRLLQSIADRLLGCVRASDTVSRQGGDEFLILLSEVAHPQDAAVCADKLLQALRAPFLIDGHDLHITASVGIVTYPEDGADVDSLIRHADFAMYDAKANGRDNRQFFKRDLHARARKRQSIENDMHHALERQELKLHFQPNVNLTTGQIIGVEALVRWQHPDLGLLAPADFIPIAEESGLIVPIGRWVLTEACRQARAWHKIGLVPVLMSVNISAMEMRTQTFLDRVRATLESTGLEARFLELELTEAFLMQDSLSTSALLRDLKHLGLRLALDDFGTGYSSLNHLRRFPIDTLKIDRSFVGSVATNADDARIVRTLIDIGRNLQMRVVAEGVETSEQLTFLQHGDCPFGQGYYFGHPLTGPDCTQILRRRVTVNGSLNAAS